MSAIGLDDIMNLTDAAEAKSQAAWLPGTQAPTYLDGSLPGDFGFDPLGFGSNPAHLARFQEAELMHSRWCMLAVTGMLAVELLGFGSWIDAPLGAVNGNGVTWFGQQTPFDFPTLALIELALMGGVEGLRASAEPEKRMYPGGAFDPFGFSKDSSKLEELKLKEIKNGRLAMVAVFGNFMQGAITHQGPVANWAAHIADPFNVNVATTSPIAIPYLHLAELSDNSSYWSSALPPWYPGN